MKKFTKLALAASVALSANAMAMQAMDDSMLSATTGQDGISIGIGISKVTIDKVFVHDNDGLNKYLYGGNAAVPETDDGTGNIIGAKPEKLGSLGGTGTAGAIVIQGTTDAAKVTEHTLTNGEKVNSDDFGIYVGANYSDGGAYLLTSRNLADLTIDTDGRADGAFLNIAADVSGLEVVINEIGVTASNAKPDATATNIRRDGDDNNYNAILSGLSLLTGPMSANVQLGAAPQGAMIKLDATMYGGLTIKNLGILDNSTKEGLGDGTAGNRAAGEIFIGSIKVADELSKNLVLSQDIGVYGKEGNSNGYIQIISNSGAHDIYVETVKLGSRDGSSIGDIEIQGMQTYYGASKNVGGTGYTAGAKITISGH